MENLSERLEDSFYKDYWEHLKNGEQLTFEIEVTEKGPMAINLKKAMDEVSHSYLKVVK